MATATKLARRTELIEQLGNARKITDELFRILQPHAIYQRPIAERHRIIFYIGHLDAFDWNLFLRERPQQLESFDTGYDKLFAFGIDPVDGGLPTDRPEDWPALENICEYRQGVRRRLDEVLNSSEGGKEATSETPLQILLQTAIEHRLMHAETLAYMFHRLPFDCKVHQQQPDWSSSHHTPEMIDITSGTVTLGLHTDGENIFGWDNECDAHRVDVPSFRIGKYMVTNGEYLQFVLDGGYREPRFWSPADWAWITERQIGHPAFWIEDGNSWLYRGMFETLAPPLDWPVYVSHAEASAYARWAGKTLPSEAQWHRAAYGEPRGAERGYPWGDDSHFAGRGNFDFVRWDAAPVQSTVNNASAFGAVGMLGNGWEWTREEFAPFKGFKPFSFYPGYSANFFDGKHFVMKGGSSRTAAALLRRSFRNWFQPHYQYVYAGFRCVSNEN